MVDEEKEDINEKIENNIQEKDSMEDVSQFDNLDLYILIFALSNKNEIEAHQDILKILRGYPLVEIGPLTKLTVSLLQQSLGQTSSIDKILKSKSLSNTLFFINNLINFFNNI